MQTDQHDGGIECLDRRESNNDRRKCADCVSHPDMERFRTQVKTGVIISSFFLLTFMGWMAGATLTQAERSISFEKEIRLSQEVHKKEVQKIIDDISCNVNEIAKSVHRVETAIATLIEVSAFERALTKEERDHTRQEIESIKKNGVKNSTRE